MLAQVLQEPLHSSAARVIETEASHAKDSPYSSRQASTVIYTSEHGPGSVEGYNLPFINFHSTVASRMVYLMLTDRPLSQPISVF